MNQRTEKSIVILIMLIFMAGLIVTLGFLIADQVEQVRDAKPTLPPEVWELDTCIKSCLEECEVGTLEHRDCAEACLEVYLEAGKDE